MSQCAQPDWKPGLGCPVRMANVAQSPRDPEMRSVSGVVLRQGRPFLHRLPAFSVKSWPFWVNRALTSAVLPLLAFIIQEIKLHLVFYLTHNSLHGFFLILRSINTFYFLKR